MGEGEANPEWDEIAENTGLDHEQVIMVVMMMMMMVMMMQMMTMMVQMMVMMVKMMVRIRIRTSGFTMGR